MDFIIHLLLSLPSFSHEVIIPKYSLCQRLQHPFPVISHTTPLLPTADCPAGCRSSVAPSPSLVWFMSSLLSVGQSLIFTSRMLTRLSFIDNVVTGWWRFCCSFFFFYDQILATNIPTVGECLFQIWIIYGLKLCFFFYFSHTTYLLHTTVTM